MFQTPPSAPRAAFLHAPLVPPRHTGARASPFHHHPNPPNLIALPWLLRRREPPPAGCANLRLTPGALCRRRITAMRRKDPSPPLQPARKRMLHRLPRLLSAHAMACRPGHLNHLAPLPLLRWIALMADSQNVRHRWKVSNRKAPSRRNLSPLALRPALPAPNPRRSLPPRLRRWKRKLKLRPLRGSSLPPRLNRAAASPFPNLGPGAPPHRRPKASRSKSSQRAPSFRLCGNVCATARRCSDRNRSAPRRGNPISLRTGS